MGKHKDKVDATLKRRQDTTPKDGSGYHFIKPGSENMKKGYSKKNGRR